METKTIGDRIRELRITRRLTQEDLGEMLGVKKAAIQKYENGSIVNLKIETIEKIAEIFNVSPSYIMGWEKFDHAFDVDVIKREIIAIENIQQNIGTQALRVIGVMYSLTEEGKNKIMEYANDMYMIDYYADKEKRDEFIKKYPLGSSNIKKQIKSRN